MFTTETAFVISSCVLTLPKPSKYVFFIIEIEPMMYLLSKKFTITSSIQHEFSISFFLDLCKGNVLVLGGNS